jgi:hypothetical protein
MVCQTILPDLDLAKWFAIAKRTKIVAPVFWHKDLAGEQLWFQEVW